MLQEHTNLCNIFEQEHGHFIKKGCTPLATFLLLPWTFLYIAAMRLSPAPVDFTEASPGKDQATDLSGSSSSSQKCTVVSSQKRWERQTSVPLGGEKSLCEELEH